MDTIDKDTAYELQHAFPVAKATLFNAFISAATLKSIWGVSSITVDAKPGGRTRAKFMIGNQNWDFTIIYQELVPGEKLRWLVHFDQFPTKETQATLSFRPAPGGSQVTVRMENFESSQERDANRQAWQGALKKLETILDG